eukprot:11358896-Ditylum_brightwellii.AAC.1
MDKPLEGKRAPNRSTLIAFEDIHVPPQSDELFLYSNSTEVADDKELCELFLNYPPLAAMQNPITMLNIQQH